MGLKILERESEPYSRYGNISAEGIQKLLGTPNLDRLQTVIRETVQNSWDARSTGSSPEFLVSIRKLNNHQLEVLQQNIFSDLPEESDGPHPITECLSNEKVLVLELCDYGTTGLGGTTHPDEVPGEGESRDFVDFIRNIGSPRDTEHGGGTYGYGKSSLYAMSKCQTILVDTLTNFRGRDVRRLIALRVSRHFDIPSGDEGGRYTGRHWWGERSNARALEPVTGNQAEALAKAIGLPARGEGEYGTSIMLLDPDFSDVPVGSVVHMICETLLWNFWPKTMRYDGKPAAMGFRFELNGTNVPLPRVEDCPPLDVFASAMRRLKEGADGVISIGSKSPKKHIGKLSIRKAPRGARKLMFNGDDSLAPAHCCHVALMRPAELVVKYLAGQPLPTEKYEWAGVFVCSDDEEVEHAFASSEPPAHDDWIPNYLPKGRQKTFVNVALREIKRNMREYSGPIAPIGTGDDRLSLAKVGDTLGSALLGVAGEGIIGPKKRHRGTGRVGRKAVKLGQPTFRGLEEFKGEVCARFEMDFTGPNKKSVKVAGSPAILMDGGASESSSQAGDSPRVLEWRDEEGQVLGTGNSIDVRCGSQNSLVALVTVPGYLAVSFKARVTDS